jgi:hypothetical protein
MKLGYNLTHKIDDKPKAITIDTSDNSEVTSSLYNNDDSGFYSNPETKLDYDMDLYQNDQIEIDYDGRFSGTLGFTNFDKTDKTRNYPAKPGGLTNIVAFSEDREFVRTHEKSHNRSMEAHATTRAGEEGAVESYMAGRGKI